MSYTGVGVIVENNERKILLHLRDKATASMPNQWCLIGGRIEDNEHLNTAATREVFEEANLILETIEHIGDFEFEKKKIALMYATVDAQQEDIKLGEGTDMKFIDRSEINNFIVGLPYLNPYLVQLQNFLKKF